MKKDSKKEMSKAKIDANRKNSKKSTGPENTTVTRFNATKHGLLSREVLMAEEDKNSLEQLVKRMRKVLAPADEIENILVDRIVSSIWRLRRAIKIESAFLQAEYDDCSVDSYYGTERGDTKAWNTVVSRELGSRGCWLNLTRYETAIERQMYKALHELIRLQSARKGEKPPAPIAIDVDITKD